VTGEKETAAAKSCAGYVLAGGASSRFGADKALAQLGGKTMLARMRELLGSVAKDVRIVAASAEYGDGSIRAVPDRWPGEGPLGGIITALEDAREREASTTHCLIVSCDMPFLNAQWLEYLSAYAASHEAEIVAPRSRQGLEPLCACWRVGAAEPLRQLFESGMRKITDAFAHVRTEILDEEHWKRFDSADRLFWNMNTQQDYENAVKVLEQESQ
jgi:molybdenum cofactor guanylyltransferase